VFVNWTPSSQAKKDRMQPEMSQMCAADLMPLEKELLAQEGLAAGIHTEHTHYETLSLTLLLS